MMSKEALAELKREIMALGYDERTAGDFAVEIGDTPVIDRDGYVLVKYGRGTVRLKLKFFEKD
jgi:hypothetical protein